MANYSINSNLPGAKKVLTSEPAAVVGSSTIIPMFVVALAPAYMQQTIDGYLDAGANTDALTVVVTHTVALKANELVGSFVYAVLASTGGSQEAREIVSNTAANANSPTTITVSRPFTTAVTTGYDVNIRRWEDFNVPRLFTSFQQFAETFLDKDSAGDYVWTGSENAYYTISEFKAHGGSLFYVLPVISSATAGDMVGHLAPTTNATFLAKFMQLSPRPEIVCCPKQPKMQASLTASNWASVDTAWNTLLRSVAGDDTVDDELWDMFYVTDTPSAVTSAAATYRSSDLNTTSERVALYHGQYMASSLTKGQRQSVALSPAACGLINYVAVAAPESWGHAVEGSNYTQVSTLGMVEEVTQANRLTLASNGINALITKPGRGSWLESGYTQAKSTSDVGADPIEHLSVIIGRAKIWNSLQPILSSVVAEPNTSVVRAGVKSRIESVMNQYKSQGMIAAFLCEDVTSTVDVNSGTARFELRVVFNREIDFIELKLSAAIGG